MVHPIRFLLDENVQNSVIDLLESRGHEVLLSRDLTAEGTPDTILAILTSRESLVVISHDRHFRSFKNLLPEHDRNRLARSAGRIQLEMPEVRARDRLEKALPLIEVSYADCRERGVPFMMTIQKANMKFDKY